jgi:hypothetical protein
VDSGQWLGGYVVAYPHYTNAFFLLAGVSAFVLVMLFAIVKGVRRHVKA